MDRDSFELGKGRSPLYLRGDKVDPVADAQVISCRFGKI